MPRDLQALAEERKRDEHAVITQSPDPLTDSEQALGPMSSQFAANDDTKLTGLEAELALKQTQSSSKRDRLHPYTQTLTVSDIASCQIVEDDAFPPHERCTKEKFEYRLSKCPELSLGIFTSSTENDIATSEASLPVSTQAPARKAVLLGHILATRTTNPTVTDDDMAIPSIDKASSEQTHLGHREHGRTICVHSLAVLSEYRGLGLGSTLMRAYIQRMETQGQADRIAIIVHDHLLDFYKQFGFVDKGQSKAQFGGGGWRDMVLEFSKD